MKKDKLLGAVNTVDEVGNAQTQTGGLIIHGVAKPKHVEEHTLAEASAFQPWEVTLSVQKDAIDPRLHDTCYYVRAKNPSEAATLANKYWMLWERAEKGIKPQEVYPDTIKALAKVLDELEWKYIWNEVKAGRYNKVGMQESPSVFTKIVNNKEK